MELHVRPSSITVSRFDSFTICSWNDYFAFGMTILLMGANFTHFSDHVLVAMS